MKKGLPRETCGRGGLEIYKQLALRASSKYVIDLADSNEQPSYYAREAHQLRERRGKIKSNTIRTHRFNSYPF